MDKQLPIEFNMSENSEHKLITCILPHGVGHDVLEKLEKEKNILTASVNHARGSGKLTPQEYRGAGEQTEKEILEVVVPAEQADAIFEYLYITADINRPHGGLMYMATLGKATPFVLPDLPLQD